MPDFKTYIPGNTTVMLTNAVDSRNNENLLQSTFYGSSPPNNPTQGQKWCCSTNNITYVFTGVAVDGQINTGWDEDVSTSTIGKDVIDAYGTQPSLAARLEVALNDDGSLKLSAAQNPTEWVDPGLTYTYVNTTQFTTAGDKRTYFSVNRPLKITTNGVTVYTFVTSLSYSTVTTVTVRDAVLNSAGITNVQYGWASKYTQDSKGIKVTPTGNITAVNVQDALAALDSGKLNVKLGTPSISMGAASFPSNPVKNQDLCFDTKKRIWYQFGNVMWQEYCAYVTRANSTAYTLGVYIVQSGHLYKCTLAGTSNSSLPVFITTPNSTTTDGTVVWTEQGVCTTWASSTWYSLNSYVIPVSANGHVYVNTAYGTSGTNTPAWPTTTGTEIEETYSSWIPCATMYV
jgi:hypothetical protein